jgi:sigma-B regulation protein RsbU (phosphoserine phosphatase)
VTPTERLRDIEAVTDAALSRLDERALLRELLERVKQTLHADTAAVLLLDRSARQLVAAAASGIEEEVIQGALVPLGTGFAGRVAAAGEPVILNEVSAATVANPLLIERGLRSLLGVPLFAGGKVIGVLHVGSLSGRRFDKDDVDLLRLAADRAALALHSLMAQDDAQAAVALQNSLVPEALPAVPGLELAARYVPGTGSVGGDWYDVFPLPSGKPKGKPSGRLGIVVGDVAGSGLKAAVIMGRMRSVLRAYALETSDPAVALTKLDRKIQYFEPDAMATVMYGVYDSASGELAVSCAGHPPPVLATPGQPGDLLAIRPDPPIGAADAPARHTATATIPPGGLIACYTDGLVERRDRAIDAGISQLAATMDRVLASRDSRKGRPVPLAQDTCAAIMRDLVGHAEAPDDVALLVAYRGAVG